MIYFYVGFAGIIGALLRYFVGLYFNLLVVSLTSISYIINQYGREFYLRLVNHLVTPSKIFSPLYVNSVGSWFRQVVTTFSTFSIETVQLLSASKWGTAILYVLLSLWGGLLVFLVGLSFGNGK